MPTLTEKARVAEPPKAALALALAIVKHKPVGTTVKDYIYEIRKSIREVDDSKPLLTNYFFDSVHHWQKAYQKSEAEQIKLHNIIFELKQKNESLLATIEANTPPPKRKAFGEVQNEPEAGRKRAKTSGRRTQSQIDAANQEQDETRDQVTEKGISFLRHIWMLQRTLQAKRRRAKVLAMDAVNLCKEAERGLLDAVRLEIKPAQRKSPRARKIKEPDFLAVVNAVELAFQLVHQALRKIPEGADNRQSQPRVIYYMVCLFQSIMTGLTQYCTAVSQENDTGTESTGTTGARQPPKKIGGAARGSMNGKPARAQVLVELLCKMALSLDTNQTCDQKVMEGFMHVILDRLGKMLALFTFDGMQLPTNLTLNLRPPEGLAAMRVEGISRQTGQLEAKQLVFFLEKVLKNKSLSPPASTTPGGQAPFNLKLQEAMKKTLLQAVFGKEDPLFLGGLERPTTPAPTDYLGPPNQRLEFTEWFAGELWRLVGWDILDPTSTSRP